jgi:hypothetical protein
LSGRVPSHIGCQTESFAALEGTLPVALHTPSQRVVWKLTACLSNDETSKAAIKAHGWGGPVSLLSEPRQPSVGLLWELKLKRTAFRRANPALVIEQGSQSAEGLPYKPASARLVFSAASENEVGFTSMKLQINHLPAQPSASSSLALKGLASSQNIICSAGGGQEGSDYKSHQR